MTLINSITVCARPLLARVFAASVGVICMTHMAGSLWGQPWDCTTSTMCWTNSNVGIGTSTPTTIGTGAAVLSVTKSQNGTSSLIVSNNTNGTAAVAAVSAFSAGGGEMDILSLASGYTNVAQWADSGVLYSNHPSMQLVANNPSGSISFYTGGLAERMRVTSSGNVGIGTAAPGSILEVNGGGTDNGMRLYSGGSSHYTYLALGRTGADALIGMAGAFGQFSPAADAGDLVIRSEGKNILFSTDASGTTNQVYFKNGGNVGIGTTSPQSRLAVNGTITTREVVITNTGWSDYVFKPNYHLPQLSEVAAFIKAHHHLPEIPSEAEVQEKGFKVGAIEVKLLAKVEELTLHAIQAEERNNRLEQQNRELQQRLARLEARIVDAK